MSQLSTPIETMPLSAKNTAHKHRFVHWVFALYAN